MDHQDVAQLSFEIPGKVFVLGEYAVLAGEPILGAAIGPKFKLTAELRPEHSDGRPNIIGAPFAEQSPAGRLLAASSPVHWSFDFTDPLQGAGGLGASTAQFALAYAVLAQEHSWLMDWKTVWQKYRALFSDQKIKPSGADLVAQWRGGVSYFDPKEMYCLDVWPILDWSKLLVFSASHQLGRKTATHEHLSKLEQSGQIAQDSSLILELKKSLYPGLEAVRQGDLISLGQAMDQYADTLWHADLEIPSTHEDRLALRDLPGVMGVKGSGALQSDAVLVLIQGNPRDRERVIEVAESRGLKLVCDGVAGELGISKCRL